MKPSSRIPDEHKSGDSPKKPYRPPTLTVHGKARDLTRSGTSGTSEGPGKSPVKRA